MMGQLPVSLFITILLSQICNNNLVNSENRHAVYSDKEINAIDKLRPLVEEQLALDFQRTNSYLLRWLRISKFDVSDAAEALKTNHQWRKKNKIDTILDEPIPRELPYAVDGVDRAGRPIVILPFGKWNLRKFGLSGKGDVAVRQVQRVFETGIRKAFEMADRDGKDVDQIYLIENVEGYALRTHACAACLPIVTEMIVTFASGIWPFTRNLTVINAPRIFDPVITLSRSFITKVPIYNYDTNASKEALLKDIAPDQLASYLGGTRQTIANKSPKGTSETTTN